LYQTNKQKQIIMKNEETLKAKIVARLTKWGNNEEKATEMVKEHFDYVNTYYTGVSKMAEVIMYL